MKVTTSTGVVLDTEEALAPALNKQIKRDGLKGFMAAVATFPDGRRMYLILKDNIPVYEHQSMESVACFLDVMSFDKEADHG